MLRKIIRIDEEKCDGCGLCAEACREGAIGVIDGKARLLREDYCDGLGNCLPVCPAGAITFEERDAKEYNEEAVKMNEKPERTPALGVCPGGKAKTIRRDEPAIVEHTAAAQSLLAQWPVQIKLVPVNAPYLRNAALLVSAVCCAYAYGDFHNDFMRNKIVLIGCPKLDDVDYSEKLTEIIRRNDIKSVTVVRMEVPCCGGIEKAVITSLKNSGKMIPWRVITLSVTGGILPD
ncbi:MAG: 4Fe-4S binding protein [Spirochaetaceae bacterium]|nr:4Fe-4S binding protein [Spirochaetaceae bacterium]